MTGPRSKIEPGFSGFTVLCFINETTHMLPNIIRNLWVSNNILMMLFGEKQNMNRRILKRSATALDATGMTRAEE